MDVQKLHRGAVSLALVCLPRLVIIRLLSGSGEWDVDGWRIVMMIPGQLSARLAIGLRLLHRRSNGLVVLCMNVAIAAIAGAGVD